VQYFATNHLEATKELARICGQLGQRALVGKVCADQNSPDYYVETTEGSIRDAEEFIQWCFNQEFGRKGGEMELVKPVIVSFPRMQLHPGVDFRTKTPRFIPTCSLPLLKALGELAAKYDVHIQSHAAETPHQVPSWPSVGLRLGALMILSGPYGS
jgi:guanine deaminase